MGAMQQTVLGSNTYSPDMLSLLADDSAQLADNAATFCSEPGYENRRHIATISEVSAKAAQRATWAAAALVSFGPPAASVGTAQFREDAWNALDRLKATARRAAEAAASAADCCKTNAEAVAAGRLPSKWKKDVQHGAALGVGSIERKRSRVPCKFFLTA